MGKRGPPPIQINWDEFDKLVSFQCTQIEIAAFFGVSVDLLELACLRDRGEKLSDLWDKKKYLGKVRLRKAQFAIVESKGPGAATMAIFLGKQLLGQVNEPAALPPPAPSSSSNQAVSFETFCERAGYPIPYARQIEMLTFALGEKVPRMILGARGYGKTDYITILGLAYDVYLNGKGTTNLIITKSKSRNTAIMEEIANALRLNGIGLEKENSSCVRVNGLVGKDHSVEAVTIKTSLRGRHPKRVVMDDPVTDEDISEAMRALVKRKYDEVMKLCANVCVIGQPAHKYDLYADLRPMIKTLEIAYGSIPELDHDLEAQRLAGVDEASIQASYYLNVLAEDASPFDKVRYIDEFIVGDSVAWIDPSHKGKDFTAISILRAYGQGIQVVGFVYKKAWNHCVDNMTSQMVRFGVRKCAIETNGLGTMPVEIIGAALAAHGIGCVGKDSSLNKHAKIMAAGAAAEILHLSKQSDRAYLDQVKKYEYNAKNDDAPDSLASCLEWIGLIRGKI